MWILASEKNKLELFYKELGKVIYSFRKDKNYSLEELGLQIGLDRSAMHRIENGKPISVTTIIKLAIALNKEPKDFFNLKFSFKAHELGDMVKIKKSPKKKLASKRKRTKPPTKK